MVSEISAQTTTQGDNAKGRLTPDLLTLSPPSVVFIFSGQGPQNLAMGRELYREFPVFRDSIDACDIRLKKASGISLVRDVGLFGAEVGAPDVFDSPMTVVASLAFLQIALVDLLRSFNVESDATVGHSLGEIAMCYAAGVFDRTVAADIAACRSIAMSRLDGCGEMLAVGASAATSLALLREVPDAWIAAVDSPRAVTLAGKSAAIEALSRRCNAADPPIFSKRVSVSVAYHTPLVFDIKDYYLGALTNIFATADIRRPRTPVMSTVLGNWLDQPITPEYCWENVERPVLFQQAIESILATYPDAMFVEIAPHPVLSGYVQECGGREPIAAMHRMKKESDQIIGALQAIEDLGHAPRVPRDAEPVVEVTQLDAPVKHASTDIAIVGMGCRFPGGANDPDEYWQFLLEGRDAITKVPPNRWSYAAYHSPVNVPGKIVSIEGGFLDDIESFDAAEFGISPAEARAMDPAQRILLEVTHQALEDAGVP